MKDRAGNELAVGDKVLYLVAGRSSSRLYWGKVVGFSPKMIRIKPETSNNICVREPASVVKPFRSNDEAVSS